LQDNPVLPQEELTQFPVSCQMWRTIKSGTVYFAIVFGIGFLLGLVRVPLLEPRLGVRWAELVEMPLMLIAIILAARFVVRKESKLSGTTSLGIGVCALALLLVAELTFVLTVRGITLADYIAGRDPVSGTVYLLMLCLMMLMPLLMNVRN
jgi:hypothetical protein